jgi:hypothetical protein
MIKILICLILIMLHTGCATQPETKAAPKADVQGVHVAVKNSRLDAIKSLKIGMSRSEVEKLLGEPGSIKETASGLSYIWVFGAPIKPGQEAVNTPEDRKASEFAGIAASAAGMVHPAAGLAARLGTVIYDSVDSQPESKKANPNRKPSTPFVLTVEFREDKVFSIQRTRLDSMVPSDK